MALPKQISTVRYEFYSASASAIVTSATGTFTINDYDINVVHENPLGNPTYSKSLNGYLVPYGVKSRVKFNLKFNKMVGTNVTTARLFFNNLIEYHNDSDKSLRFYFDRSTPLATAVSTSYMNVVLENPMEMNMSYKNQVGNFVPSISLISQELLTSVNSSLEGV